MAERRTEDKMDERERQERRKCQDDLKSSTMEIGNPWEMASNPWKGWSSWTPIPTSNTWEGETWRANEDLQGNSKDDESTNSSANRATKATEENKAKDEDEIIEREMMSLIKDDESSKSSANIATKVAEENKAKDEDEMISLIKGISLGDDESSKSSANRATKATEENKAKDKDKRMRAEMISLPFDERVKKCKCGNRISYLTTMFIFEVGEADIFVFFTPFNDEMRGITKSCLEDLIKIKAMECQCGETFYYAGILRNNSLDTEENEGIQGYSKYDPSSRLPASIPANLSLKDFIYLISAEVKQKS